MLLDDLCTSTLFEQLTQTIGSLFSRSETRKRAAGYIRGLLGQCQRKNGWQLAESLGENSPDGVQYLLDRAHWDTGTACDVLRQYIIERLGSPEGILILDETGFLKKGKHSAGVQRQYSGTAGRVENFQIVVFLCYSGNGSSAFIDHETYQKPGRMIRNVADRLVL